MNLVTNKNTAAAEVPQHRVNSFSHRRHYMIKEGDDYGRPAQ